MAINVVIVAFGDPQLLRRALEGVAGLDTVVVDNGRDPLARAVALEAGARYVLPERNLGFAGGVNLGLAELPADGDVLLLNPDARCTGEDVATLGRVMAAGDRVACASPRLVDDGGVAQRVSWPFPSPSGAWLIAVGLGRLVDRRPGFLIGAVLLVSRAALQDVGGFDESFFLYAEETDWQKRASDRGWSRVAVSSVTARHVGAASSADPQVREIRFAAGQERYIAKWYGEGGARRYRCAVWLGSMVRSLALPDARRRRDARLRAGLAWRGARRVEATLS